jgi:hypothetical protein
MSICTEKLNAKIDAIATKEDLADFISEFRDGLSLAPDEWKNFSLENFFGAMEAWIRVIDSYTKNTGDNDVATPSWKTFAKILCAAKVYE